ncbi:NAD(+)/NADH kinase [Thalassoroseus pseudoceratinae]|uniref:NAD(+)/NADH kinase n=1 Tax=Thalassoroseus pseudoceratinae TaxID=2713176 RepID=UPI00142281E2|nr:NAD(+)/NADH kinase [Thalassoroseus pseudoceratinae]
MATNSLKLIVLARDQSPRVQQAWGELSDFLKSQPGTDLVAAEVTEDLQLDSLQADLVVVLGGDGAILRACRQLGEKQLPILGINHGRLGFLADLSSEEFRDNYQHIENHEYRVVEHLMYECRLIRADGSEERWLGLNEVAITAGASFRMIRVDLNIDGEKVTTYSCDGLIVSTPVGSTAHSLSAGGPLLRQNLQAFVITPICPHTLSNRPLVDGADCVYRLAVPEAPEGVLVVVDGQIRRPIACGDIVEIRRAPVTFQLARLPNHSYYRTLHRKLGWSGQPHYRR